MLLNKNALFAWSLEDMPDIELDIIYHKLAIDSRAKLVSQKMSKLGEDKQGN